MRSFNIAVPFGVLAFAAGCSGSFTELGQGTGHGGMGAAAGMAGAGTSGTAGLGTGGTSTTTGGTDSSGGTGANGGKGGGTSTGGTGAQGGSDATGGSGGKGGSGGDGAGGSGATGGAMSTGGSGATGGTMSTGGSAGMSGSGGSGGYDPCAGKDCGTACSLCDPSVPNCISDNIARFCDASGICGGTQPTCPTMCKTDADCPITDIACRMCSDGSTACPYAHCVDGACNSGIQTCPGDNTCQGKACGETCQAPCTGGPGNCVAPLAYCDTNMQCQIGSKPMCPACQADSDCGSGYGHRCVDQIGGAGNPAGFECAVQLACGSVDPCACIQNEGTCTYVDGSPGYCQCDNGIR